MNFRNSRKLVFSDLDHTLINESLEKNFIKFVLFHGFPFNFLLPFMLLTHFFIRQFCNVFGYKNKFKMYYFGIRKKDLKILISRWISSSYPHQLNINIEVLESWNKSKYFIVLSNCPSFLIIPYLAFIVKKECYIFSSQISDILSFPLYKEIEMKGEMKALYVKKIIQHKNIFTEGFGNKPYDLPFLKILDKYHLV